MTRHQKPIRKQMADPDETTQLAIQDAMVLLWSWHVGTERGNSVVKAILVSSGVVSPPNDPLPMVEVYADLISTRPEMLINCANIGWQVARDVLCDFASDIIMEGKPQPPWLPDFLIWAMRNAGRATARKKGRDPLTYVHRDFTIATVVRMLVEEGFRATRSGKAECACSIVTKALQGLGIHMSEKNVVKIWRATKKGTQIEPLFVRPIRAHFRALRRELGLPSAIKSEEEAYPIFRELIHHLARVRHPELGEIAQSRVDRWSAESRPATQGPGDRIS